ncbi:Hypothetical protein PHPALM_17740 [Phytophthora palmivora]|uniref:Uncharacterized protein n=1 Tax=Phytophthora palmivora TaxID=4796 RepID=A0A2P4XLH4_9STRA|nr:Hypothetical protein PHPALM_17740 [Phytophthora palmivora]
MQQLKPPRMPLKHPIELCQQTQTQQNLSTTQQEPHFQRQELIQSQELELELEQEPQPKYVSKLHPTYPPATVLPALVPKLR